MATVLLAGNAHLSYPNLPRDSRHHFLRPKAFPFGRYPLRNILPRSSDLATWQPSLKPHQVIHCFNQIPLTRKPWIVTFEQALPYDRDSWLTPFLTQRLLSDSCAKLIAISDYAKLKFLQGCDHQSLSNKLEVVHPNFPVRATHPKTYQKGQPLNLIFIGNQFARKGGIVALRLAKKAHELKLPIVIHLVSQLALNGSTDHLVSSKYEKDLELLNLPTVIFHKQVSNSKVIELLAESHFQLMATLHDTYGYSIIEGFSVATPAITTNVCALPELVRSGENGHLLNLELDDSRQWKNWLYGSLRESDEYWDILDTTFDNLMNQALEFLIKFLDDSDQKNLYEQLSLGSLAHMDAIHNPGKAAIWFDDLYAELAQEI
ncbi:MAG: glycosyltransferase family 4 protein [Phormidesmis sp. CAN_BIN36]|nr:glycosyltransferase family 4 protein [Phormidesmis sp. CAN_BIN36]